MRFWDTSAVVPLVAIEPGTSRVRRLLDADPAMVVWWATRTEIVSAIARQARDGTLDPTQASLVRGVLDALSTSWSEVVPSARVRDRAERLLHVHPLRAADAFQLAAALLWSRGQPTGRELVSFDDRLRTAAGKEGFLVLPN